MFKTVAVRVCTSYLQHHLESLTEEDFGRHRQALSVKRSEKPKKLKDECAKYWGEIISQQYHFVRGKHIGPPGFELCWHALGLSWSHSQTICEVSAWGLEMSIKLVMHVHNKNGHW